MTSLSLAKRTTRVANTRLTLATVIFVVASWAADAIAYANITSSPSHPGAERKRCVLPKTLRLCLTIGNLAVPTNKWC